MARGVVCGPRIACVYVTSTCNCLNLTFLSVRGSQGLWPAVIFTKLSSSSTTITWKHPLQQHSTLWGDTDQRAGAQPRSWISNHKHLCLSTSGPAWGDSSGVAQTRVTPPKVLLGSARMCVQSWSSNWFLLTHLSVAEIFESSAVFCAPQPQNPRSPTSTHSTHIFMSKKSYWNSTCIHTHAHRHSLPCTRMWGCGKHPVKIPRQRGGQAGVMSLPLMWLTSSLEPSTTDLLQELIKIPLKNNYKMKQIVLSGANNFTTDRGY